MYQVTENGNKFDTYYEISYHKMKDFFIDGTSWACIESYNIT